MTLSRIALASALAAIALSGCSKQENPLISMCQGVTTNLAGTKIDTWMKAERVEVGADEARVDLQFPTGVSSCFFMREEGRENSSPGDDRPFDNSPYKMTYNGQPVGEMNLMRAVAGSTGAMLKDAAKETSERAAEIANNADEKAKELADQAGTKIRDLANTATEKAKDAAMKASEAVQEQLKK